MTDTITASDLADWLRRFSDVVHEQAAYLTELDSAIGDADHGANMDRGMRAVMGMLDSTEFESADAMLKKAGMTLVSTVGGASGPLYGTFFLRFAAALAGSDEVGAAQLGQAFRAGVEGIVARGKAEIGDKTMVDAWWPAVDAYDEAVSDGGNITAALTAAAEAAAKGCESTIPLVARKGRASYLGERSAGHQDPGATSTTLLVQTAADTFT
jgi:dihydroxyacetone kinase-like protein